MIMMMMMIRLCLFMFLPPYWRALLVANTVCFKSLAVLCFKPLGHPPREERNNNNNNNIIIISHHNSSAFFLFNCLWLQTVDVPLSR